jgi:xylulose-5-phosphate/fructose-6-phosphate phosphoketolase
MVMLNDLDRYHLVMDVIDRVPALGSTCATLRQQMADKRIAAREYTRTHGDDIPEVKEWVWPAAREAGLDTGQTVGTDTGGDNE